MENAKFYESLNFDFSFYEEDEALYGLCNHGFNGQHPLHVKEFNLTELKAARSIIACYLSPVKAINSDISSYGLKHLVERALCKQTKNEINNVSNGSLILAMIDAGFKFKRESKDSPNCFFNVSKKSLKRLTDFANK